jgi:hypothetical protein
MQQHHRHTRCTEHPCGKRPIVPNAATGAPAHLAAGMQHDGDTHDQHSARGRADHRRPPDPPAARRIVRQASEHAFTKGHERAHLPGPLAGGRDPPLARTDRRAARAWKVKRCSPTPTSVRTVTWPRTKAAITASRYNGPPTEAAATPTPIARDRSHDSRRRRRGRRTAAPATDAGGTAGALRHSVVRRVRRRSPRTPMRAAAARLDTTAARAVNTAGNCGTARFTLPALRHVLPPGP